MSWQITAGGHTDDPGKEEKILSAARIFMAELRAGGVKCAGSFHGQSGHFSLDAGTQDEPPGGTPPPGETAGPGLGGGGGREGGGD